MIRTSKATWIVVAAITFGATSARAADFYADKTITMVVGSAVGGGFDTFARLFSRHLGRSIPGSPAIVVQNMPGAGSAKAAGFVFSAAAKDGTVVGALNPGGLLAPLFAGRSTGFDATKLQYLASADTTARVCISLKDSRIKTFKDAQQTETVVGAAAVGSSSYDYAFAHQALNHGKFRIVAGYKGMADILLAMDRKEVEVVCGYDWSGLKSARPSQIKEGGYNVLLQVTVEPVAELDALGVPQATDLTTSDEDKAALQLIAGQQLFGRPYAVAPEVPAERVAILRKAFADTMADPRFLSEVDKLKLSVTPAKGENVQTMISKMYSSPKTVVARANKAIRP